MAEETKTPKTKPSVKKKSFFRKTLTFFKWMVILGFAAVLFAGGTVAGYITSILKDEPVRSRAAIEQAIDEDAITGFAYFRDTSPIGQLRTDEDRRPVGYDQIPQNVMDALVSIEDKSFYEHPGIDTKGTLRAVKQKVLNEPVQTGGSTLTQQLARRVFLSLDKTNDRKIKEILLSLRMERFLSKEEIITAYLNKMPFGKGSSGYNLFGVKAAAKGIFGLSDPSKLNLAQAAYLAGLPQLPTTYSAFDSRGALNEKGFASAVSRQHRVLENMLEDGKITQVQYKEALDFDLETSLAARTPKAYATYPYLMAEVEREATKIIMTLENPGGDAASGEGTSSYEAANQMLLTGGYKVYTTIDRDIYKTMRNIAENPAHFGVDDPDGLPQQVAASLVDQKTGAVIGMIEGRSFDTQEMNLSTQMVRQPGSTMKPIAAYLPALDSGLIQPAGVIDDAPIILPSGSGYHIPKNANGRYQGLVTARYALNQSLNIPALKLFNEKVGIDKAWAFAKKLGITTIKDSDYNNSTGVIGGMTSGVTVKELTGAYAAIGNGGEFNETYMIDKIVDSKGNIVYKHQINPSRVFSAQTAYLMTNMLETVVSDGTGNASVGNIPNLVNQYGNIAIAGKTGSTQNYADVWFMGYTPDLTLGVWTGYTVQKNTMNDDKGRARIVWAAIMNDVMALKPELFPTKEFTKPEGIVSKTVSGYSGKLPTDLTVQSGKLVTDIFNEKYVPTDYDDGLVNSRYIVYNGVNYVPHAETPDDMVLQKVTVNREKPINQLILELKEVLSKVPNAESLSYYIPADAGVDAPKEVDPRGDDGYAPSAPVNVWMNASGTAIAFTANPENDVVGYRLYRSTDGGASYQYMDAVLTGNFLQFGTSGVAGASYYVAAVDVVGNESSPSRIVGYSAPPAIVEETPPPAEENPVVEGEVVPNETEEESPVDTETEDPQEPVEAADPKPETEQPQEQPDSEPAAVTAPAEPSQLQGSSSAEGVQLSWPSSEGASSYTVYYSATAEGPFAAIGTTSTPSFTYTAQAPFTAWFKVSASNEAGESPQSMTLYTASQ
ncbi:transglycosylase domain-containing protein [Saccharibacillus sp. CPCC 101409]|uniref:transglycosylase domain-containing protein n=1 Tax=Saccharibacillus sp. CPCC 101409 TaxID=3058041 RepID=UPI002671BC70|nr:transglycosylase domain-containing protein [Saccharibacillus sp. CPCC 101409]MDO3409352.1 transglycosylase domain-containing protein [Saccharibacillus sp. CPCC 101409]